LHSSKEAPRGRGSDKVTDAGLKELAACKQLQWLGLDGCDKVTDAGLKELARRRACN
jgi:hypothetical protein